MRTGELYLVFPSQLSLKATVLRNNKMRQAIEDYREVNFSFLPISRENSGFRCMLNLSLGNINKEKVLSQIFIDFLNVFDIFRTFSWGTCFRMLRLS